MTQRAQTMVEPCPFCGKALVRRDSVNPYARCVTPDCFGAKMPVVSLDVPADIDAWNTRSTAAPAPGGIEAREALEALHDFKLNCRTDISRAASAALKRLESALQSQPVQPSQGAHGCKRSGGFVDTGCTAACDCHVTLRFAQPVQPATRSPTENTGE